MTAGSAKAGHIGTHDSIFEARVELDCVPLEGDTIFESPHGHHFSVLKRDELDGTEGARGLQRAILGMRVRLPVFTSLITTSTTHLYLVSMTVW